MTNNVAMQIRLDEFLPPPSLFITGIMEATTFIHICTCRIQCLLIWNRGQMARLTSEILEILPSPLFPYHLPQTRARLFETWRVSSRDLRSNLAVATSSTI